MGLEVISYTLIDGVDLADLQTGLAAGERNADGEYPKETINFKIEQRLLELAELKHEDHQKDEHCHDEHCHDDKESKKDK